MNLCLGALIGVLIAIPGTVPVQWRGGSTPRPLCDILPLAPAPAGVPGPGPRGPSQGVGSRANWVERRKDGALGTSEMLPSGRGSRVRRRQPGGRHDALA